MNSLNVIYSYSLRDFTRPLCLSPPTADAELQPSSVRGGEDNSLRILLLDMTTFSTIFN